jgi:hypothetical protein
MQRRPRSPWGTKCKGVLKPKLYAPLDVKKAKGAPVHVGYFHAASVPLPDAAYTVHGEASTNLGASSCNQASGHVGTVSLWAVE